jgi:hypothetical protein
VATAVATGLVIAACGAPPLTPSPSVQGAPSVEAVQTVEPLPPLGVAKLDPPSGALVKELGPGEWTRAELSVTAEAPVRRLATEAGLQVAPGFEGAGVIVVLGPLPAILRVASDAAVVGVVLREDDRALRPVAAPLPANTVLPVPALPYVGRALVIPPEQGAGAIPAGRRAALMAALEGEITTIDGAPYSRLQSSESCEPKPVTCRLSVTGQRENASLLAQADVWDAHLVLTPTGVQTTVIAMSASALPRWLAREAERIARSDGPTAVLIGRYATLSTFRWASGGNLVISIEYTRTGPCKPRGGIGLGPRECTDALTVAVDPAARTVVDVDEALSP